MQSIDLDSSALAWVRYLHQQRVLQIALRTGRIYDYFDVPPEVYHGLIASESKGSYYNTHIRNDFAFRQSTADRPRTLN